MKLMPAALFLRHGQYPQPDGVPSAHLPYGLSPEGEAQIRAAAPHVTKLISEHQLKIAPIVWSSHLPRAQQSAHLLTKELNRALNLELQVQCTPELAERCLGSFANLTVQEIEECLVRDYKWPAPPASWKRDPHYRLPGPGAESLSDAGARVLRFVEAHASEQEQLTIYVGHGGAFRHSAVQMGVLSIAQAEQLSMHYGGFVLLKKTENWRQTGGAFKERKATQID